MLSGLAEAIKVSANPRYIEAAAKTVKFIFTRIFKDGFLLHTYKDGKSTLQLHKNPWWKAGRGRSVGVLSHIGSFRLDLTKSELQRAAESIMESIIS
jgi:hypothetical protein